ncbi:hypothetical protein [Halomonas sp. BC04]|uniref:hypothetical protein n=1 Tax=Halomonas sp. BC04 TaxID=1403540 RepID=UPI001E5C65DD|nr:hypothetical protein [Halomonas sp. BC04]
MSQLFAHPGRFAPQPGLLCGVDGLDDEILATFYPHQEHLLREKFPQAHQYGAGIAAEPVKTILRKPV